MKLKYCFKIIVIFYGIFLTFLNIGCGKSAGYYLIPSEYVYCILENNDSIYYSTQRGEIYSFHLFNTDSIIRFGLKRFFPIRSFVFRKNGEMIVSSYQTGLHLVKPDTLLPLGKMHQRAWAMKIDKSDNIWIAGLRGVYRQKGDTLLKFSQLSEAYDIDFYNGKLVVAHRGGITFFDTTTCKEETSFFLDTICWTLDVFENILVVGGVNMCAIIKDMKVEVFKVPYKHNIPWSMSMDSLGNLYFGTQYGLFMLKKNTHKLECIGFKKKCIKSVLVDSKGRLWVGRYFKF